MTASPVSRGDDGPDQGLDAAHLADHHLVLLVVARQVGEDPRRAGHDVDVGRAEELDEALHQVLHVVQLGAGVGEVSQGPEAVLDEPLAGVAEVDGQGLHAAGVNDGGLVARADGQD